MAREPRAGIGPIEPPGAAEARAGPPDVEGGPLAATVTDEPFPLRAERQGLPAELVPDDPWSDLDAGQDGAGRGRQSGPDAVEQHADLRLPRRGDAPGLRRLGQDPREVRGATLEVGRPLGPEAVEAVFADLPF